MGTFIEDLKNRFGPESLKLEFEEKYLTDFIGTHIGNAQALLFARSKEDVIDAVKIANAHKERFLARGAGTNLVGSTIPEGGLVIDLSGFNRILELDEKTRSVKVEPGVLLCDLQEFVEQRGLFYPPDPAEKSASIGGNISTNAGGMRAVKYGVTRDYVLELEVVLSDGQYMVLGSNNLKDSTGLNLKHLFIGSEGSLGIIVGARLRLITKPSCTKHIILAYESLKKGIEQVNILFASNLNPTAVEFIEKKVIALGERYLGKEFPCPDATAYLLVSFDGNEDEVDRTVERCLGLMREHTMDAVLLDEKITQDVWAIRSALAKSVKDSGTWEPMDIVVPIDRVADFVRSSDEVGRELGIRILTFGHAGDGNVHLCIMKDEISVEKWPDMLDRTMSRLYDIAYDLGGLVSAEHGIGKGKRKYFFEHTKDTNINLMQEIKKVFDQELLINPHSGYAK